MALFGFLQGLSLVETMICGFIAGNALLSGSFAVQAGLRRSAARGK